MLRASHCQGAVPCSDSRETESHLITSDFPLFHSLQIRKDTPNSTTNCAVIQVEINMQQIDTVFSNFRYTYMPSGGSFTGH